MSLSKSHGEDGNGLQWQYASSGTEMGGGISLILPVFQDQRVKFKIVSPVLEIELNPAGNTD